MYKFKTILSQYGFYNQQYQYCLSRYNGSARIYFFSDIVLKIKRNECWLLNSYNINEHASLSFSIKFLNNYLDFDHGKQIIIRENSKFIWTIQKKNTYKYKLNRFKRHYIVPLFSKIFNLPLDKIIFCYLFSGSHLTYSHPCVIINNKYLIYDIYTENLYIDYQLNMYFFIDAEAVVITENIKKIILKNIKFL